MSKSNLPLRASCRGLVFDDDGRVLLAQHRINEETTVWVGPGGGVEDGESLVEALARELFEETGLVLMDETAPALVWTQENRFPEMEPHGYSGVSGHFYVVPLGAFTREVGSLPRPSEPWAGFRHDTVLNFVRTSWRATEESPFVQVTAGSCWYLVSVSPRALRSFPAPDIGIRRDECPAQGRYPRLSRPRSKSILARIASSTVKP